MKQSANGKDISFIRVRQPLYLIFFALCKLHYPFNPKHTEDLPMSDSGRQVWQDMVFYP